MRKFYKWFNRDSTRSNQRCLYCGVYVGKDSTVEFDEEHLIGRNFVPTGSMEDEFNFSFRACRPCNARKAVFERALSSHTLIHAPHLNSDRLALESAQRKALGDVHPETKVKMGQAFEQQSIESPFFGGKIRIGMSGPTPLPPHYVPELAFYHIQALFALIVNEDHRIDAIRLLAQSQFEAFNSYNHKDWGNPELNEIINRASALNCFAVICSAKGHFRACLRRGNEGWFWALEWNKSLRVIGAIKNPGDEFSLFQSLPTLDWKPIPDGSGYFREEQREPDLGSALFPESFVKPEGSKPLLLPTSSKRTHLSGD